MKTPEFRFCEEPQSAAAALEGIASERVVAFDLEADSLHSYREKVCLVQVSDSAANLIIDPFSCAGPLQSLSALFSDETVEKVFHGGDYDIRLLKKEYSFEVRNVFDTMIAAPVVGKGPFRARGASR